MRFQRALIAGLTALLILLGQVAATADEMIIDVESGSLITGGYNIPLDKATERPIRIGFENGNVVLIIKTNAGSTIRLNLGQQRVALTPRANAYISIEPALTGTGGASGPVSQDDGGGKCTICGKPLAVGKHSRYACGHYVCKAGAEHAGGLCPTCGKPLCDGGDHAVCPECGKGFCGHDDQLCSYRNGLAPNPTQTPDPAGLLRLGELRQETVQV